MTDRPAAAALATLILLQAIMLSALFAGVPPHPPAAVTPFAMAPFLAAAISAAVVALILDPASPGGRVFSALAALAALVSFGPHKYVDPQFPLIWPAVLGAQAAIVTLALRIARPRTPKSAA